LDRPSKRKKIDISFLVGLKDVVKACTPFINAFGVYDGYLGFLTEIGPRALEASITKLWVKYYIVVPKE
jgi:hypothetical protein